jgi:enoyl-CoA hydratase/carnithine racemase
MRLSVSARSSSKPFITVEKIDRVLELTFEDPLSRNSFSLRAAEELAAVLHEGEFDAIVFTARGRVFCSGGNLADYAALAASEEGLKINRRITEVLDLLARQPVPTVCAVNGDCFGGGVELISAFDFVLATPSSFFGLWQRKIALSFGWGGGRRLEHRLGLASLKRLALEANELGAREALEFGLIDAIVPESLLMARALEKAKAVASLSQAPLGALKTWSAEREREVFESLWWNNEHRRALASRRHQRRPGK